MFRHTVVKCTWMGNVQASRQKNTRLFGDLNFMGTKGANPEFDAFLERKREEKKYEEFDQRVERAFQKAWQIHKSEIWNAQRRQVREGTIKKGLSMNLIQDLNAVLDERKEWLRNVWAQTDADYRSGDEERVARATKEIEAISSGRGNEYMEWAYQTKYDMRFMGPKEREELENQLTTSEFPSITEEEASRFVNRRMDMNALEKTVIHLFGAAGREHWQKLQQEKDEEYTQKIDDAFRLYEKLFKEEEEARGIAAKHHILSKNARVDEAKQRLAAALDREEKRQSLVETDKEIKAERSHQQYCRRREAYQTASKLRTSGTSKDETLRILQRRSLEELQLEANQKAQMERTALMERKRELFEIMRSMQRNAEERSTLRAMSDKGAQAAQSYRIPSKLENAWSTAQRIAQQNSTPCHGPFEVLTKKNLWKLLHDTHYVSPSEVQRFIMTIARLDARKTYSSVYRKTRAQKLRHKQYADQSVSYSHFESRCFSGGWREAAISKWGISSKTIHDLDEDPANKYVQDRTGFHRMEEKTGDIDIKEEKRRSEGPIFHGKTYYNYPKSDI